MRISHIITYINILFLLALNANAQPKYAANWCFFQNNNFGFISGVPVNQGNSSLVGWGEGSSTISDPVTGQLLFYTDGQTVYNRLHNIMDNGTGLKAGLSSTQGAIILPKPCDSTKFYIFTTGDIHMAPLEGLTYSLVDMSASNGLGAVSATKNITLDMVSAEKMTAVIHRNNRDYWLITISRFGNNFYSRLVTDTGVRAPIISQLGADNSPSRTGGYMKISPDGKRLAKAYYKSGSPVAEIFDFDDSTGIVSNATPLLMPEMEYSYGLEFSPNSKFLYINSYSSTSPPHMYQFDVSENNITAVNNSKYNVTTSILGDVGMQLAYDGKIYYCGQNGYWLDVINNPNMGGALCNISTYNINLPHSLSRGTPNFVCSFFSSSFSPICKIVNHIDTIANPIDSVCMNKSLKVFPNPFSSYLKLEFSCKYTNLDFILFNTLGQMVYKKNVSSNEILDFTNLTFSPGIYFYRLFDKYSLKYIKHGKLFKL